MDRLPDSLQLEILNRLNDPTDLSRCRLVSKTLNALSYNVQSLKIICSYDRYLKSRAPESQITPFKSIVKKLLLSSRNLETISIGLEDSLENLSFDDGDEDGNELYLMDDDFVSEWLPQIGGRLKSISISDFRIQSHWRVSKILDLISSNCNNLVELTLKNSSLSVEGLKPMSMLTSLTLRLIKLDDAELNLVNKCFPSLRILNLIGVEGLTEPRIHLLHLQTCTFVHHSLVSLTIDTPNLMQLNLTCEPMKLVLQAPLLSVLLFSIEKASKVIFGAEKFPNLKTLMISSPDLCNLIKLFSVCTKVENLVLQGIKGDDELTPITIANANCEELMSSFPNVTVLQFRFGVLNELIMCFFVARGSEARSGWKRLEKLMVYVEAQMVVSDIETVRAFISHVLNQCPSLSGMIYDHSGISSDVASTLITSCMGDCPWVKGRQGMWKRRKC